MLKTNYFILEQNPRNTIKSHTHVSRISFPKSTLTKPKKSSPSISSTMSTPPTFASAILLSTLQGLLVENVTGQALFRITAALSVAEEDTICWGAEERRGVIASFTGVVLLNVRLVLWKSGLLFVNSCVSDKSRIFCLYVC